MSPPKRISELDGIRGSAVGLILFHHFWPTEGAWKVLLPLSDLGWIGVDLFFVLSGFLITGILLDNLGRPDYFRRFYLRRAARIFPLYYAFLLLIFGFLLFYHGGNDLARLRLEWGSPAWFFLYLANFVCAAKGMFPLFGPLGPTTSLQIEEQFYLVFPTVVRLFHRRLPQLLIATMIGSLAWRIAWLFWAPDNSMIQYVGTPSRLDGLAAGGLMAWLARHQDPDRLRAISKWAMPLAMISLAAFYLRVGTASSHPLTRTVGYSLNALSFAALILWAAGRRNQPSASFLRWRPALWLGKISYGVYLLQLPVQSLVKLLMRTPLGTSQRFPTESLAALLATLAVASISWRWFEKPLLDWAPKDRP